MVSKNDSFLFLDDLRKQIGSIILFRKVMPNLSLDQLLATKLEGYIIQNFSRKMIYAVIKELQESLNK